MAKTKNSPKRAAPNKALAVVRKKQPILTRRKVATVARRVVKTLPAAEPMPAAQDALTVLREGEIAIANLGLEPLTLTPEQEQLLSQPVDTALIRWKPKVKNGPPEIPYVPHVHYRRLYNQTFGRLGWALVPIGVPLINNNLAIIPYVLTIYGKRVKFAYGEQDYFESNKQQTYGDVLESTKASALRRISKDLGIWLELWDKDFLDTLPKPSGYRGDGHGWGDDMPEHRGEPRRVNTPPAQHREPYQPQHANADDFVHENQVHRFWSHVVPNSGRSEDEVKAWLFREYGVQGSAKIKRRDYDAIERAVKAPGPLPARVR